MDVQDQSRSSKWCHCQSIARMWFPVNNSLDDILYSIQFRRYCDKNSKIAVFTNPYVSFEALFWDVNYSVKFGTMPKSCRVLIASRWWKLRPSLLRSIWAIAHWPQHCWFHAFNARSRSEPVEFMHDLHIAEINRPGAIFLSLIFSKFCIQLALQRSTVWYIDVLIRSFKVIEIDTNRKPVWDFLSFFHRKYVPIFYW